MVYQPTYSKGGPPCMFKCEQVYFSPSLPLPPLSLSVLKDEMYKSMQTRVLRYVPTCVEDCRVYTVKAQCPAQRGRLRCLANSWKATVQRSFRSLRCLGWLRSHSLAVWAHRNSGLYTWCVVQGLTWLIGWGYIESERIKPGTWKCAECWNVGVSQNRQLPNHPQNFRPQFEKHPCW